MYLLGVLRAGRYIRTFARGIDLFVFDAESMRLPTLQCIPM